MICVVKITDTMTGVTRDATWPEYAWGDEKDGVYDYLWSEGNYSCDCNRGMFFAQAAGEPDPDMICGESRYAVKILSEDGSAILYEDARD